MFAAGNRRLPVIVVVLYWPVMDGLDLLLVRHADTVDAGEGVFIGRTDRPLTDLGRSQADELATLFRRICADRLPGLVCCSPLLRARQTMRPIADALGADVVYDERLQEIDFGPWDGLHRDEITRRYPDARPDDWYHRPTEIAAPGGETLRDVDRRVATWLAEMHRDHRGSDPVLVLAHFCPLVCIAARELGMELEVAPRLRLLRGQCGRIADGVLRFWGLPWRTM